MSAWTVSKEHIDLMLRAAGETPDFWWGNSTGREYLKGQESLVGAMLWNENYQSVNHRYQEEDGAPDYQFRRGVSKPVNPIVVIKQIHCYEYQTCEHPEWGQSDAKAFCDALQDVMIRLVPGYDDAPWGILEDE